jgi:DNA-directed RNA polymerase subunit N (RpoN/RPB10)
MENEKCIMCGKPMAKYWEDIITKFVCNNEDCLKCGYKCGYKDNNLRPKVIKIKK